MAWDLSFEVLGVPVAKGRPRLGKGRIYTPSKTTAYEKHIAIEAKIKMKGRKPHNGAIGITILAYVPIPKSWSKTKREEAIVGNIMPTNRAIGDVDNIAKIVLDGLNGIAYEDDKQVISMMVAKVYGIRPKLEVNIQHLVRPYWDNQAGHD